ncbi:MAG: hypothetical protein ACTSUB_02855 [Candidatus Thorarchaeota archaeon]
MPKGKLDSSKVICVVDKPRKIIWLWKGKIAGMQHRFAGARVARILGKDYGRHFIIMPVEDEEEPAEFRSLLAL